MELYSNVTDPDAYYRQVYYKQFHAQPEAQPGCTQMYLSSQTPGLCSDERPVGLESKFEKFKFRSTNHQEKRKMPQRRVNTVSFSNLDVSCLDPTPQDEVVIGKQPNISEPGGTHNVGETMRQPKFNETTFDLLFDISLSPIFGSSPEEPSVQPFTVSENVVPPSINPDMVETITGGECSDFNANESTPFALRAPEPVPTFANVTELYVEGECPNTKLEGEIRQVSKTSDTNNGVSANPKLPADRENDNEYFHANNEVTGNVCHRVLTDHTVPQDTSGNNISDTEGYKIKQMEKNEELSNPAGQNIVDKTVDKEEVKIKPHYKKPLFKSAVSSGNIKAYHLNTQRSSAISGQGGEPMRTKKQAFKIPYRMTQDSPAVRCNFNGAPVTSTPKVSSMSMLQKLKSRHDNGRERKDNTSHQLISKPVDKMAVVYPCGQSESYLNEVPRSLESRRESKISSESEQTKLSSDKPSSSIFSSLSLKKPEFFSRSTLVKAKSISKMKGTVSSTVEIDEEGSANHAFNSDPKMDTHYTDPVKETYQDNHECAPIENNQNLCPQKSNDFDPFSECGQHSTNSTSKNELNVKPNINVRFSSKNWLKSSNPSLVKRKCNEKDKHLIKLSKIDGGDKFAMDSSETNHHGGKETLQKAVQSKKQAKGKGKKSKNKSLERGTKTSSKAETSKGPNKDGSKGKMTKIHKQKKKSPGTDAKRANLSPPVQVCMMLLFHLSTVLLRLK